MMCDLVTGGNGSVAIEGVPTVRCSLSSSMIAGMVDGCGEEGIVWRKEL